MGRVRYDRSMKKPTVKKRGKKTQLYTAARLEGVVKNRGIKPQKKSKAEKKKETE